MSDESQSLREAATTASDFRTYLVERYQGEVFGEALFGTLAAREVDERRQRCLRALEQLERETKERIRPTVEQLGESTEESAARRDEGVSLGAGLASVPWPNLMASFRGELEKFVREFERAEALAPTEHRELARALTRHEVALLEFVAAEVEGRTESSLDPVNALLREPST